MKAFRLIFSDRPNSRKNALYFTVAFGNAQVPKNLRRERDKKSPTFRLSYLKARTG